MDVVYSSNLIFLVVVNILFFFSGIFLNSVVIISFWKFIQLRKKLCYFMIMILSCCDLLAVLINNPLVILFASLYLTESFGVGNIRLEHIRLASWCGNLFFCFSLLSLLVMSCDRYLATHHLVKSVVRNCAVAIYDSFNLNLRRISWKIAFRTEEQRVGTTYQ